MANDKIRSPFLKFAKEITYVKMILLMRYNVI